MQKNSSIGKIYINYLVFGHENSREGHELLLKICNRMFPMTEVITVEVDNSRSQFCAQENNNYHRISGNNTCFEFSGWDAGFKYIKQTFDFQCNDLIVYANDTLHRRSYANGGNKFLDIFDFPIVEGKDLSEVAIGFLDDFPKDVTLMGMTQHQWIRSNIFMISSDVATQLHPLVFPLEKEYVFGGEGEKFFRDIPEISENWRAYISSWLFAENDPNFPEYNLNWLKSEKLTEQNRSFFQTKATTILSEHYLTARLFKWNIEIIDTNHFLLNSDRHVAPYYE
ncbi:MAG: hypothetical protein ABJN11_10470 [Lentilitoribacter sp.]